MKPHKIYKISLLLIILNFFYLNVQAAEDRLEVSSPNGKIIVTVMVKDGVPYYRVMRSGKDVIKPSRLGYVFKDAPPLDKNLKIARSHQESVDETWTQPWGEVKDVRNHYNELRVELTETRPKPRQMNLIFRVYDYGVGFRYELPEQDHLNDFQIMDEETEFVLTDDHPAWWIPAYQRNRYEYLYQKTPISAITRDSIRAVHTPFTIETTDGLYLCIHEANLTDYASMTLAPTGNHTLECDLVPWGDGSKVKASTPMKSPWRTILIVDKPGDLITSYLELNLNDPNKLGDVSWVKPGKYVGIWWEMHLGISTWGSGKHHGATTANAKRYIDFAAKHGFDGVLVEGWNIGWDGDWMKNSDKFSFTKPYPDFDLEEVTRYAAEKGVTLIGHHETSGGIQNYERQMEDAFALYQRLGVRAVKTGYVAHGQNIRWVDENGKVHKEWHHGQFMVRHYRKVVKEAAKYHIMLDVHEPIKDTGIRRTYPNMMSREGARGQEYNSAWSRKNNPPEHTCIIPFTRGLAGPFDFTPGIFDIFHSTVKTNNQIPTTIAKQLAIYVIIYSPLHMAADFPEHYEARPLAFKFIEDVPTDWQDTRVLNAQIGDYVTIARQDRHSEDWYLGSVTDENGRTLEAPLSFLDAGRKYVAEIYKDAEDADWQKNPEAIDITRRLVDRETVLKLRLAPGGGQAIRIRPASKVESRILPAY